MGKNKKSNPNLGSRQHAVISKQAAAFGNCIGVYYFERHCTTETLTLLHATWVLSDILYRKTGEEAKR